MTTAQPALNQYCKDYTQLFVRGFYNDVPVTKLSDESDTYQVMDANGGVSQGALETVTLNGESKFQKTGEWKTSLPNGHTLVKTYGDYGLENFREAMYNEDGTVTPGLVMFDRRLVSRKEYDQQGAFVSAWSYNNGAIHHFNAEGKIEKTDYMNCRETTLKENLVDIFRKIFPVSKVRALNLKS